MMKSIQLKSNVGHDGILRLQLPVDMPNQEIEIVIVIHAVQQKMNTQHIIVTLFLDMMYFSRCIL